MKEIREKWKREIGYTVRDIDITANGEYIIVGSFDNRVYLYDRQGTMLWSYLTGNTVRDVAITFDGKYMAAGSYDRFVYFFDTEGNLLWRFRTGNSVRDVSISADGEYVLVGSNDRKAYLINRHGELLWSYETGAAVYTVAISLKGEYAAFGSYDRKVYLFNLKGEKLWEYQTGSAVRDVEITSRGKYVAAGSYDRNLYFFNREGRLLWKRTKRESVEKVAISPKGDEIAAGAEGEVSLFNREGALLWKQSTGLYDIRGLEISTAGGSIICGTRDNELLYFEKGGRLLWRYKTPQWVETVAVGAKGRYIAAGLRNGTIYLFDSLKFFEEYLENARQAIVKLENLGTDSGEAHALYLRAQSMFKERNYMTSLSLAIRAKGIAEKSVKMNHPSLSYIARAESAFVIGGWTTAVFKIANTGNADAQDIQLRFEGPFRVRGERKIENLRVNTFAVLQLDFRPLAPGEQTLDMGISYFDFAGREYTDVDSALIPVEENASAMSTKRVIFRKMPITAYGKKEASKRALKCPNCNRDVSPDWLVCPYCATPLK